MRHLFGNMLFSFLMIIAGLLGGGKAYIDHQLSQQLNNFIRQTAQTVAIHYQTINLTLLGEIVITQLQLRFSNNQLIEIKRLILPQAYLLAWHDWRTFPAHIVVNAQAIQFSVPEDSTPPPFLLNLLGYHSYYVNPTELRQLGYTQLTADAKIQLHILQNKGKLEARADAGRWGNWTIALETASMPPPLQLNWQQLLFSTLAIKYENSGLFEQLLIFLAQRHTISLDIFKQTLINKINHDILQSGVRQETNSLSQLQQFFDKPEDFTLYIQANQPFSLQNLVTVSPTTLQLKIIANNVI